MRSNDPPEIQLGKLRAVPHAPLALVGRSARTCSKAARGNEDAFPSLGIASFFRGDGAISICESNLIRSRTVQSSFASTLGNENGSNGSNG